MYLDMNATRENYMCNKNKVWKLTAISAALVGVGFFVLLGEKNNKRALWKACDEKAHQCDSFTSA